MKLFCHWGMALFYPEYKEGPGRLFMVCRRRASVRAGTFWLSKLLLDLGIVQKGSKQPRIGYAEQGQEVLV